jgi:type III restriction enzyme
MQQYKGESRVVVLEIKDSHLSGNDDTEYKKAVLRLMTTSYADQTLHHLAELELVRQSGSTVECDLVLFPEWKTAPP